MTRHLRDRLARVREMQAQRAARAAARGLRIAAGTAAGVRAQPPLTGAEAQALAQLRRGAAS